MKRDYNGDPIDLTDEQWIQDRPKKQTVGGSEPSYKGDVSASVENENLSETEQRAVKLSITRPGYTKQEIADEVGCGRWVVHNALKKIDDGTGLKTSSSFDELSELQKRIITAIRQNPECDRTELSKKLDCSRDYIYQTIHHNKHLLPDG